MKNISVCIPYYNRADMVMETLAYPLTDDRVNEIIICDDCSPKSDRVKLLDNINNMPKVRYICNAENHHVQHNKRNAISFSKNDWCIILDNDNVIDKSFIDKIYDLKEWDKKVIYHPSFASPNFDYRQFNGQMISKANVKNFCSHNIFVTLLNTNNYFVNRDEYLRVYQYNEEVRGADGIYNAYNWLSAGNCINIVSNMQYFHRVHDGSEFLRESDTNMKLIYNWLNKVKEL